MRIRHKVILNIGQDAEMKNLLFSRDETLAEKVLDVYEKQASGVIKILTTIEESLSFGDIDAVKGIYFEVDQDATFKINGGSAIQLRVGNVSGVAKFFMEGDITSIAITAGATDLNGVYCAWGDLAS